MTMAPNQALHRSKTVAKALSYPEAKRRDAARGAGASHLVDQRRSQAGAAATKRVTALTYKWGHF